MRRLVTVLVVLSIVLSFWTQPTSAAVQSAPVAPAATTAPATPTAVNDVPTPLVKSGVALYTLTAPKLFWWSGITPVPPQVALSPLACPYTETISRVATYGSTVRNLFSKVQNCGVGTISSTSITADSDYLYWLNNNGMYQLSTNANPGDAPQLVNALVAAPGEVAVASDRIFYIADNNGSATRVGYVWKNNHEYVDLNAFAAYASDLKFDGSYVYYTSNGTLYRIDPNTDIVTSLASGVTGYYPEGRRLIFCSINPPTCFFSNTVYIGIGQSIYTYNNFNNTLSGSPIYTSSDSTASIYEIVGDFSNLYFFERRTVSCAPFACYLTVVQRSPRGGTTTPDSLYTSSSSLGVSISNLNTDGTYLFWQETLSLDNVGIQRLPNNASALPVYSMSVTGMEVTQSIQNLSNSVVLIKDKRTFVRVFVHATGVSVPGVTAQLEATSMSGEAALSPVNSVGTTITVRTNPDKNDINQSFLFELPWNWTEQNNLTLLATLNPYKVPLEDTYADDMTSTTVHFQNSPTLSVEFFRLNYTLNGKNYSPRINGDILQTYSWILRAYPIGGGVGDNFKPRLWDVAGGTELGNLVNTSDPHCAQVYGNPGDDISLCASYFANGWLYYYRNATISGDLNIGLNPNAFYYGLISDTAGFFPRGQAMYSQTSVGPAGTPCLFFNLGCGWDTDGTYADWYAGHEIGHSLGRAHPNAGSDDPSTPNVYENCGHSRSDPGFPYGNLTTARAPIGPANGSMEGFDVGDPSLGIKPAVLPSSIWNDVMSYCSNQWISDYTYTAMYNYMKAHPSVALAPASPALTGNFLIAAGYINPNNSTGSFSLVRHVSSVNSISTASQTVYSLRQFSATNVLLSNQNIDTYGPDAPPPTAGFGVTVAMASGARKLELVRNSDSKVLASINISAHAPVVSNVALVGAPNPVTGVVTLSWNASDADGGTLTYDIEYTRDNGTSFQPVVTGVTAKTAQIDTAELGGSGTARLRVIANDGVNTGFADSASFTMAPKKPTPYILTPANNLNVQYGQLVNFQGLAFDAQDNTVADSGLTWKMGTTVLGTGPFLSDAALPVGTDVITLQATDSVGQTASTTVTVIVNDNLTLPGPNLSAGPLQVGWQVPAGTTVHQTANISIDNLGSGDLSWTAAKSSASWLTLSATSGTVAAAGDPSTLTLTANPTGLVYGKTYTAQVTITQPVSASNPTLQTIVIPVSLAIGAVQILPNDPRANGKKAEFFPLIRR
jgi:hypothetical protein